MPREEARGRGGQRPGHGFLNTYLVSILLVVMPLKDFKQGCSVIESKTSCLSLYVVEELFARYLTGAS